jgi:hypothetical protein
MMPLDPLEPVMWRRNGSSGPSTRPSEIIPKSLRIEYLLAFGDRITLQCGCGELFLRHFLPLPEIAAVQCAQQSIDMAPYLAWRPTR